MGMCRPQIGVHHMKPKALCSGATVVVLIVFGPVASQGLKPEDLSQIPDFMSRPLAQRASQWECIPSRAHVRFSLGCDSVTPSGSAFLDFTEKTYSRSGNKTCNTFPMRFESESAFTYVDEPISGTTFFELLNDGSQYVEVVAGYDSQISEFSVLQNFGSCKPRR